MNRFWAHIKLLRPLNLMVGAFAVFVGSAILRTLEQTPILVLAILVVVFYNAAANAINDYFDIEIDRINRPARPLITGLVKPKTALILSVILFGLGSGLSLKLPTAAQAVAIVLVMPLMVLYSWRLKGLPLIGNGVVACILGLTFIFTGAAFGNVRPMIVPAFLAFGLTLVRELVKDIADLKGDQKAGIQTFPIVAGLQPAVNLSVWLALLIGLGSVFPYWVDYYGQWYLVILILGVEIPLVYIIFSFLKKPTDTTAKIAARLLKFSTIAGVVAVYLGGR